jgi:hypothetical protein
MQKFCNKCETWKEQEIDFYICKGRYRSYCKKCILKINSIYQKEHQSWKTAFPDIETRKKYFREYTKNNPEKIKKYRADFKKNNPNYMKEYMREYMKKVRKKKKAAISLPSKIKDQTYGNNHSLRGQYDK